MRDKERSLAYAWLPPLQFGSRRVPEQESRLQYLLKVRKEGRSLPQDYAEIDELAQR